MVEGVGNDPGRAGEGHTHGIAGPLEMIMR
jgi:hypothetical protein